MMSIILVVEWIEWLWALFFFVVGFFFCMFLSLTVLFYSKIEERKKKEYKYDTKRSDQSDN